MPTRLEIDELVAAKLADASNITATELREVHAALSDYIDGQDELKLNVEDVANDLETTLPGKLADARTVAVLKGMVDTLQTQVEGKADEIDTSFDPLAFNATLSVPFDMMRPNKAITLTGNIAITNTSVDNKSSGLYEITQDATGGRTVTINGTSVSVNPAANSRTLIAWVYNGTAYNFDSNYRVGTTLTNNLTTSTPGTALDAAQGKALKDAVDVNTSNISANTTAISSNTTAIATNTSSIAGNTSSIIALQKKTAYRITFEGQSNALGVGKTSELPAITDITDNLLEQFQRVYIFNPQTSNYEKLLVGTNNQASWDNSYAVVASGFNTFGPELGIAYRWLMQNAVGNLFINKNTADGQPISVFQKGGAYYTTALARRTAANTWLINNGYTVVDVGWLWVQGESNYTDNQATYATALNTLISDRIADGIIGTNTNIILANINTGNTYYGAGVSAAKIAKAATDPSRYSIITYTNNLNSDNVHMNAKGQIQIGYDAYGKAFGVNRLVLGTAVTVVSYQDLVYTATTNLTNTGGVWRATTNNGTFGNTGLASVKLPANTDGSIIHFYNNTTHRGAVFGLRSTNAQGAYTTYEVAFLIGLDGKLYGYNTGSGGLSGTITAVIGTYYGIFRNGSVYTLKSSTDKITWSAALYTFTYTGTGIMYPVVDINGDNTTSGLNQPQYLGLS